VAETKTFHCTVVTPTRQMLDAEVRYADVPAWDGQIAFAPRRAPAVLQLGQGLLRLTYADGTQARLYLGGGFAQMLENRLTLLTDEALEPGDVDPEEARAALREAEARVAREPEEVDDRQRQVRRGQLLLKLEDQAR